MNATAAYALALALIGTPVTMLAPFVIARLLVDRHGDQVADDIARSRRLDSTCKEPRK
ncbi:hypothetical protein [Polymorphospora sp. NPDC050346]|uniref:hypothetical protein n=1 Tax=Polymorphospora sp. NPDC050346 TaxID=3155780 RepID=UPI0033D5FBD1